MSRAEDIISFLEQERSQKQENAVSGPRDEDVARFIFNALSGEKDVAGVKIKADTMGLRKAPLNIEAEIPLQGKMYHVKAEIPWVNVKILSVE